MKIKKPSSKRKKIIALTAILIAALVGYGAYAASADKWPFAGSADSADQSQNESTNEDTSANTDEDNLPDDEQNTDDGAGSPKTPVDNSPGTAPKPADELGVTITFINTYADVVKVSTLVDTVSSKGTCTLVLEKNGRTVTKTAGLQPLPSSSTCKGFDIPVSELSKGVWNVKLNVSIGSKTGSASKQYEVK